MLAQYLAPGPHKGAESRENSASVLLQNDVQQFTLMLLYEGLIKPPKFAAISIHPKGISMIKGFPHGDKVNLCEFIASSLTLTRESTALNNSHPTVQI